MERRRTFKVNKKNKKNKTTTKNNNKKQQQQQTANKQTNQNKTKIYKRANKEYITHAQ